MKRALPTWLVPRRKRPLRSGRRYMQLERLISHEASGIGLLLLGRATTPKRRHHQRQGQQREATDAESDERRSAHRVTGVCGGRRRLHVRDRSRRLRGRLLRVRRAGRLLGVRQGTGLGLRLHDRVGRVELELPGGTVHQNRNPGGGGLGARLRHLGVTTHPLLVLPGTELDLRLGDLRLAALDLLAGQGAGLRLDHGRNVFRVLDHLPGRTLDEHHLVGRGRHGAGLGDGLIATHPFLVLPVGVGHLGLRGVGHAALHLVVREDPGLRLDRGRNVLRVLDDLPGRPAHEHHLVGGDGLGARLRHLGCATLPLLVFPVGVLDLGLGGRGLAARHLLVRQSAGLGLRLDDRVSGVRLELPGRPAHQDRNPRRGRHGAGLGDRLVTTHPLLVVPLRVGHLGLGDVGLAALDLLLRQCTRLVLGHHLDVGGVLDRDPLAVLENDLVGRGGLGARLRHPGVTTHPLGVLPAAELHLGLRRRGRRVAAGTRRRAVGGVRPLVRQRLVQELRLVRVVGSVELLRHLQRVEPALLHELGVDVVLTALVECGSGVRERSDGVDQQIVVSHQGLGPRGIPGRRQVVLEGGGADRECVAELVALLGTLGLHRDRTRADTVEGVGPGRRLHAVGLRRGAAGHAAFPVVVGAMHLGPLDFVVRPTRPVGVFGHLVGDRLPAGDEVGVVEVEGTHLTADEVLDTDVDILVVGPCRDVVRVGDRQSGARRRIVLPVPVERLLRLRAVRNAGLRLAGVVGDRDGATLCVGESPRERPREALQRVDRDRNRVVARLQALVGTGGADVLTDVDLLRSGVASALAGGGDLVGVRRCGRLLGGGLRLHRLWCCGVRLRLRGRRRLRRLRVRGRLGGVVRGFRGLLLGGRCRLTSLLGSGRALLVGGGHDRYRGAPIVHRRGLCSQGCRSSAEGEAADEAGSDECDQRSLPTHSCAFFPEPTQFASAGESVHWVPFEDGTGMYSVVEGKVILLVGQIVKGTVPNSSQAHMRYTL